MIESLTAEEVARLEEGTPIIVIWEGGNGPHRYRVAIDRHGQRYAAPVHHGGGSRMEFYNPLEFVGRERYHTRVWLTTRNATEAETRAEFERIRQWIS